MYSKKKKTPQSMNSNFYLQKALYFKYYSSVKFVKQNCAIGSILLTHNNKIKTIWYNEKAH